MKKAFILTAAAAATLLGSNMAAAQSGEPPYPTDPFSTIARYYNMSGELIGWDIYYCDWTVESYREPFEAEWSIETEDGACF